MNQEMQKTVCRTEITGCRVFMNPDRQDDRLKGFASIVLNGEFAVTDLKIINGNNGLFVAMPSRRRKDGVFHDVAHPIVSTLRERIEEIVLARYEYLLLHPEETDEYQG